MRQTDRRTADTVMNIARNVMEPSRMLQRVAIVISEQKTVNTIFMTSPCAFSARLEERRKLEDEKLRKEDEKQKRKVSHSAEKSKTRTKNSLPHVKSK